jgi:zinc resistance-associated protein
MKASIVGIAAGTLLLAGTVLAQDRGGDTRGGSDRFERGGRVERGMGRFTPEDLDAFVDARLAGLRAGLRLTGDQESMWPAVDEAIRGLVRQRREQRQARSAGRDRSDDLPAILHDIAERQAARAEALRKLADAATPLYASLDEGQKRRLRILARPMQRQLGVMGGFDGMRGQGRGDGQQRRP